MAGSYDKAEDFQRLNEEIKKFEKAGRANRLFYMALPPSVYKEVATNIRASCMAQGLVLFLIYLFVKPGFRLVINHLLDIYG